jgi:hypothetical protein
MILLISALAQNLARQGFPVRGFCKGMLTLIFIK